MATSFPSGLDSFTNPGANDALDSPSHADQHSDVNDAVEALQAKVGVDGSAVVSSFDFRVRALESASFVFGDLVPVSPGVGRVWRTSDGSSAVWDGSSWLPLYPLTGNTAVLLYEAELLFDMGLA